MGGGFKGKGKGGAKGAGQGDFKGDGKGKGKGAKGKSSGEAPAARTVMDVLPVGTELQALYADGDWYKAHVVQVRKKFPEVKITFDGFETVGQFWLGVHMLRSRLLKGLPGAGTGVAAEGPRAAARQPEARPALPEAGSTCQVDIGLSQYQEATVIKVDKKKEAPVRVQLSMWVYPEQLKAVKAPKPEAKAAPAKAAAAGASGGVVAGTALTAMADDGNWYLATVLQVRKGPKCFKIHFEGWDAAFDKWVSEEEVRSKLLKAAKAAEEEKYQSKGKGTKGKGMGKGHFEDRPPMRQGGKSEGKGNGKGKGKGGKGKGK